MGQNLSKRQARKEFGPAFRRAIDAWRDEHDVHPLVYGDELKDAVQREHDAFLAKQAKKEEDGEENKEERSTVQVFVRKRPLFAKEAAKNEYDVVSCLDGGKEVVVHDGRMHPDMKRGWSLNYKFAFDRVFDETASNERVYQQSARPLVLHAARDRDLAAVMMYGQTGSGKTHTMTYMYRRAAEDLFASLKPQADSSDSGMVPRVSLVAFEIIGAKSYDLLQPHSVAGNRASKRREVFIREGRSGRIRVRQAYRPVVHNADELFGHLRGAIAQRSTSSTQVNDVSSRSHFVVHIFIDDVSPSVLAEENNKAGDDVLEDDVEHERRQQQLVKPSSELLLIDLAGSERKEDSMFHDAEQRRQSAEINTSLMVLKDCVRARCMNSAHVPFRGHKLTQVLKQVFLKSSARLAVIATLSPIPTDTEHTINTLKHACLMNLAHDTVGEDKTAAVTNDEFLDTKVAVPVAQWMLEHDVKHKKTKQMKKVRKVLEEGDLTHPKAWANRDDVAKWLTTFHKGRFAKYEKNLPSSITGKALLRFSQLRFKQLCDGNERHGRQLYDGLRARVEKIAKADKLKRQAGMKAKE